MKLFFAKSVSLVFNPLVVTLLAPYILIYRTTHDGSSALHWTLYTLIFIFALSLFVLMGVKKKMFTDLDVSKREQRPLLFFMAVLFTSFYITSLFVLHGPYILYILAISVLLGISFASVINRKIKASMHMAAITALIVPVAISFGTYYLLLLFLIPLVAWSRLYTKRHTLSEVIVGTTIGGFLSLSIYLAVKFFLNK